MNHSDKSGKCCSTASLKEQLKVYREKKQLIKHGASKGGKLQNLSSSSAVRSSSRTGSERKENSSRVGNKSAAKSSCSPLIKKPSTTNLNVRVRKIRVPEFKLSSIVNSNQPLMPTYTKEELKCKVLEAVALMTKHISRQQDENARHDAERDYLTEARHTMRSLQLNTAEFAHVQTDSLYWLSWLKMEADAGNFTFCRQLHKEAQQKLQSESAKQTLQAAYERFVCNNNCEIPTGTVEKLTKKIESGQTPAKQISKFIQTGNYDAIFQVLLHITCLLITTRNACRVLMCMLCGDYSMTAKTNCRTTM